MAAEEGKREERKTALIFGSADDAGWRHLDLLRSLRPVVVCCDGGLLRAAEAGFQPDFYVGDGDSGGRPGPGLQAELLPTEKDLTDLQAAFSWCLRQGIRRMVFTACTGGRQDHHMSALLLTEMAWRQGAEAEVWDSRNRICFLAPGTMTFSAKGWHYFGIVPLDSRLEDVTIRNAKYELSHADVCRGDSLTISNEGKEGPVECTIGSGHALLILSDPV